MDIQFLAWFYTERSKNKLYSYIYLYNKLYIHTYITYKYRQLKRL